MINSKTLIFTLMGAAMLLSACTDSSSSDRAASSSDEKSSASFSIKDTYETIVDANGNISLPRDVAENWYHLGSFAVVNDGTDEGNGLHHVYTTPDVIEHFNRTGEFADGSVLLKDVTGLKGTQLTTGRSHWATETAVWFVMVKDTEGRFPGNPLWGDGWGWALFNGSDLDTQVATDYKTDCLSCHIPVEDRDWIHTFAYPSINGGDFSFQEARLDPAEMDQVEVMPASMETESGSDAAAGQAKFARCKTCHSLDVGRNGLGPSLAGVIGREAGTVDGFNYSDAMIASEVIWSADTLNAHLADINGFIPGNRMAQLYPNGVKDARDRADIIAYLETVSEQ